MIDIHSHILPHMDDGSVSLEMSLEMARQYVNDGVTHVICTPHIMPGVWNNTVPAIHAAVARLQDALTENGFPLTVLPGADNHVAPDFAQQLSAGKLLPLAASKFVLVEPPHQVPYPRILSVFGQVISAGYRPILTHPERLSWINLNYKVLKDLAALGGLMQVTAGALVGRFGADAKSLGARMLGDGLVHFIATDCHHPELRPANLSEGWRAARDIIGEKQADALVLDHPRLILADKPLELKGSTTRAAEAEHPVAPSRPDGVQEGAAPSPSSLSRLLRKFNRGQS